MIEDQSWIDCIDITSRWDTFVLFHLYGNKGVSLPLWPIRPRWFHTYSPCAEPLADGHEGMWARFGSQGSIALNWHSRYSGTRYSGTWLYIGLPLISQYHCLDPTNRDILRVHCIWKVNIHGLTQECNKHVISIANNDKYKIHNKLQKFHDTWQPWKKNSPPTLLCASKMQLECSCSDAML